MGRPTRVIVAALDTSTLLAAFRVALGSSTDVRVSDETVVDQLRNLHARGAEAWSGIGLAIEVFARELARRHADAAELTTVADLHHDINLAIAATAGDPRAVAACELAGARAVEFAARRLGAAPSQADEARSLLREQLFTTTDTRAAAIATFSGRGDLQGYLRVVVARILARLLRRDRREVSLDDEVADAFAPMVDPEVALLRERYRPAVDAALRAGLAALDERNRALLRYHLIDRWTIDQLGERYNIHRATAARWLTAARDALGANIRRELSEQLEIPENQVDSIVALVTSRVVVSLERLLS